MSPLKLSLLLSLLCLVSSVAFAESDSKPEPGALAKQNEALFGRIHAVLGYSDEEIKKLKSVFADSPFIGQGNPQITKHPITSEQCKERLDKSGVKYENVEFDKICGSKFMAPLYDPEKGEKPSDAKACMDQFEFPNIPCDYPVVWIRANEAAAVCEAVGKRLCDAHEWEGGCDGRLTPPDYDFEAVKGIGENDAVRKLRTIHNKKTSPQKRWAFGKEDKKSICGMNSTKNDGCNGGDWKRCGSNTYPSGSFPECKSSLEIYDQHGNAAEHMNLPLAKDQMASEGSKSLGVTEMKGSWFIFDKYKAHDDWCRWRAPYWHGSRLQSKSSHHNYHLGFRCCKSLPSTK
jgi:formylglycine-generating enzyme required for sulfatase activity